MAGRSPPSGVREGDGPDAELRLVGLVGLFAVYTRPLSVAEIAEGEAVAKAAWGIP